MGRQKGKKSVAEGSCIGERVQKDKFSNKSCQWQFLKVLPDLLTKAKVGIFSICTPPCQGLINLGSDLTLVENSAGRRGYPLSQCTWRMWVPACGRLGNIWSSSSPTTTSGSDFMVLESVLSVPLSQPQHLCNIRMLRNDWVESKNQATHVELWETTCGREK